MEQLDNDNIGVCNFTVAYLKTLLEVATITPAINQIELHPKLQQRDMREFAAAHHIQLEAWGPLMQGGLFENDVLQQLATKYERSISQINLRWDFQQGVVLLLVVYRFFVAIDNSIGGRLSNEQPLPSLFVMFAALAIALFALQFTLHSSIVGLS